MDQKLLLLINREWTHPALDWSMAVLSSFDVWAPLLLVAVIVLAIRGSFRVRAFLVVMAAIVGIVDGVVSKSLKRLTDRPRPHQAIAGVRQVDLAKAKPRLLALGKPVKAKLSKPSAEDVDGRSFPSSHTANTVAAALVTAAFWRRAWIAFVIPLLVGYSRIYTGAHWPSDVAASLVLGAAVAIGLLAAAEALWRRRGARVLPRLHAAHPSLLAPSAA